MLQSAFDALYLVFPQVGTVYIILMAVIENSVILADDIISIQKFTISFVLFVKIFNKPGDLP